MRKLVEELAQSYEKPQEVIAGTIAVASGCAEVESVVLEDNVVDWVLEQAKVDDKPVAFDELMGQQRQMRRLRADEHMSS